MLKRTMWLGSLYALALAGMAQAQCSPDYTGVTLTAVSHTGPFIASALRMAGDKWQTQTCGTLNIVEIPFGELYPKYITGMSAGSVDFDVMTYAPAWNFVNFLTNPENSIQAAITGGTGVNPYCTSHFDVTQWTGPMTEAEATSYLAAQRGSIEAPNVALDMRLPGYFSYTEILEIELSKAMAGQETPQEALDTVAVEWNKLTDQFGREAQLAAYRASMGL